MAHTVIAPGIDVSVTVDGDTANVAKSGRGIMLRKLPDSARDFFVKLADSPSGLDVAEMSVLPDNVLIKLEPLLEYRVVRPDGAVVAALETMRTETRHEPAVLRAETLIRLSRFAFLRRDDRGLLLESPLSSRRLRFYTAAAASVVTALGTPTTLDALAGDLGVDRPEIAELLAHLVGAELVDAAVGTFARESEPLRQWEFHDLVFHARSRRGRHDYAFGGIFPFRDEIEPLPAVRPSHQGPVIELPRPSLDDVLRTDPPLTLALEGRRSTRVHDGVAMTVQQLGEFLYRTGRVRALRLDESKPYPSSSRPYPTGGATYDLEFYLSVRRCDGLASGAYHYDPVRHALTKLDVDEQLINRLLGDAGRAMAGRPEPDLLITLTSRFQRLSWKYRSMAYAATLKNVGVLYQTMYLVATAMGLAACALGAGDTDLAVTAFRLNYLEEGSVGEFALGGPVESTPTVDSEPGLIRVSDFEWHEVGVARLSEGTRRPGGPLSG